MVHKQHMSSNGSPWTLPVLPPSCGVVVEDMVLFYFVVVVELMIGEENVSFMRSFLRNAKARKRNK